MLATLWIVLSYPFSMFRRRHELALEVLALHHQLMVLERQTRRPRLRRSDRYLWLLLMKIWPSWRNTLMILQPETLIGWQRAGFRMDFFVVPTVTFRLLYVLIVMNHERRKVVHFNITDSPSAA
jgi:hypothetical protein